MKSRSRLTLLYAVAIVAGLAPSLLLWGAASAWIAGMSTRTSTEQADRDTYRKKLRALALGRQDLDRAIARARKRVAESRLFDLTAVSHPRDELDRRTNQLLLQLTEQSDASGMRIASLKPVSEDSRYQREYDLVGQGSFGSLSGFLTRLDSMPEGLTLVRMTVTTRKETTNPLLELKARIRMDFIGPEDLSTGATVSHNPLRGVIGSWFCEPAHAQEMLPVAEDAPAIPPEIPDPGAIPIEELLSRPSKAPTEAATSSPGVYVTKPGEGLWQIAARELGNGARWTEIADLNHELIPNPHHLSPGISIRLPERTASEQRPPKQTVQRETTPKEMPPEKPAPKPAEPTRRYTVQAGDTLWSIAVRQLGKGARASEIVTLNPGLDPSALSKGMELLLPESSESEPPRAVRKPRAPSKRPRPAEPQPIRARKNPFAPPQP